MITTLLYVWGLSALVMAAAWWFSMRVKNVGYVDVVWAALMSASALLVASQSDGSILARIMVAIMGGFWGARLCLYLLTRVLHEAEDGRYQALRAAWQGSPSKFFMFFQMQAVIVLLFAIPFYAAANSAIDQFNLWHLFAIITWLISVCGESISDKQLANFRNNSNNKGKTCRDGLWAWSRHPNYFFEWLHWFSYVFIAIGSGYLLLSFIGPVVMLAFLYRVSGIPWTEAQALRSRGDDYQQYQRQVSAFFPWPPKRVKS
jgi:steroid 5-alpha reductase family enzyme